MTDLANLRFRFDSSDARQAKSDLSGLRQEVRETDQAARRYKGAASEAGEGTSRFQRTLPGLNSALGTVRGGLGRVGSAMGTVTSAVVSLQGAVAGLAGGAALGAAVSRFSEMETGLTNVAKTADLTDKQVTALQGSIEGVASRVPVATESLVGLAGAAGQLGVSGVENLTAFTETLGKLELATDIVGEKGARSLARLINVTGEGVENVDRFGSAITALGNSLAATEGEILNTASFVAGRTSQFDLAAEDVLGLSGALTALGAQAETAGSGLSRTFSEIQSAVVDGTESLDTLARVSGTTTEEFARAFREDALGALLEFIEGYRTLDSETQSAILEQLNLEGIETADIFNRLATGLDDVTTALATSNDGFRENTALNEEAARASETFSAQMQLTKNAVNEVAVDLGERLAPMVLDAAEGLRDFIEEGQESGELEEIFGDITDAARGLFDLFGAAATIIGPPLRLAIDLAGALGRAISGTLDFLGQFTAGSRDSAEALREANEAMDDQIEASQTLQERLNSSAQVSREFADSKLEEAAARLENARAMQEELRTQLEALQTTAATNLSVTGADLPGPTGNEDDLAKAIGGIRNELAILDQQADRTKANIAQLGTAFLNVEDAANGGGDDGSGSGDGSGGGGGGAAGAVGDVTNASRELAAEAGRLTDALFGQRRKTDDAADAQDRFNDSIDRFRDEPFRNAIEDIGDTLTDKIGGTLDSLIEKTLGFSNDFTQIISRLGANLLSRPLSIPLNVISGGGAGGGGAGGALGGGGSFSLSDLSGIGSLFTSSGTLGSDLVSGSIGQALGLSSVGGAGPFGAGGGAGIPTAFGNQVSGALNSLSSLGGAAGAFGGNFAASSLFGGNRSGLQNTYGNIGGTIGAVAGSFIPIPVVGPAIGSFLGNFIGGQFGPGLPSNATGFRVNPQTGETIGSFDPDGESSARTREAAQKIASQSAEIVQALQQATGEVFQFASVLGDVSERNNPDVLRFSQAGDGSGDRLDFKVQESGEGVAAATLRAFLDTAENLKPEVDAAYRELLTPSDEVIASANDVDVLAQQQVDADALRRLNEGVAASRQITEQLKAFNEEGVSPLQQSLNAALDPLRERRKLIEREGLAAEEANTLIDKTRDSIESGFVEGLEKANRAANDLAFLDDIEAGLQQFATQFRSAEALSEGSEAAAETIADTLQVTLGDRIEDFDLSQLNLLEDFLKDRLPEGSDALTAALAVIDERQRELAESAGDAADGTEQFINSLNRQSEASLRVANERIFGEADLDEQARAAGLTDSIFAPIIDSLDNLDQPLREGSDRAREFGERILDAGDTLTQAQAEALGFSDAGQATQAALTILTGVIADGEAAAQSAAQQAQALADAERSLSDTRQNVLDQIDARLLGEQEVARNQVDRLAPGFLDEFDAIANSNSVQQATEALRDYREQVDRFTTDIDGLSAEEVAARKDVAQTITGIILPVFDDTKQSLESVGDAAGEAAPAISRATEALTNARDSLDVAVAQRLEGQEAADQLRLVQAGLGNLTDDLREISAAGSIPAAEEALRDFVEQAKALGSADLVNEAGRLGTSAFDRVIRQLEQTVKADSRVSDLERENAELQREAANLQSEAAKRQQAAAARVDGVLAGRDLFQESVAQAIASFREESGQTVTGEGGLANLFTGGRGLVLPSDLSSTIDTRLPEALSPFFDDLAGIINRGVAGQIPGSASIRATQGSIGSAARVGAGDFNNDLRSSIITDQSVGEFRAGQASSRLDSLENTIGRELFSRFFDGVRAEIENFIASEGSDGIDQSVVAQAFDGFSTVLNEQTVGVLQEIQSDLQKAPLFNEIRDALTSFEAGDIQGFRDATQVVADNIPELEWAGVSADAVLNLFVRRLNDVGDAAEEAAGATARAIARFETQNADLLGDAGLDTRLTAAGATGFDSALDGFRDAIEEGALTLADAQSIAQEATADLREDGNLTEEEIARLTGLFGILRNAIEETGDTVEETVPTLDPQGVASLRVGSGGLLDSSFGDRLRAAGIEGLRSFFEGFEPDIMGDGITEDAARGIAQSVFDTLAEGGFTEEEAAKFRAVVDLLNSSIRSIEDTAEETGESIEERNARLAQTSARLTEQFANLLSPEGIGLDTQLLARGFGGTDGPIASVLKQEANAIANGELDIDLARSLAAQLQDAFTDETDQTPEAAQRFEEALRIINGAIANTTEIVEADAEKLRVEFTNLFGEQSIANQLRASGIFDIFGNLFEELPNELTRGSDAVEQFAESILDINAPADATRAALRILVGALDDAEQAVEDTAQSLNTLAIRGQFENVFGEQSIADQATAAGLGGSLSSVLTDISNSVLPFTDVARELGVEVENLTDDEQTRTAALRILSSVLQENAAAEQEAARRARERRQEREREARERRQEREREARERRQELEREAQERRQVTQTRARLTEQFANLLSPEGIGLDTQLLARGFGGTDGPIAAVLKQEADAIANGELDLDLARSLAAQLQSAFVNETDQTPEAAQRFEEALRLINDAIAETTEDIETEVRRISDLSRSERAGLEEQFSGLFGGPDPFRQAQAAGFEDELLFLFRELPDEIERGSTEMERFRDRILELNLPVETTNEALRILSGVLVETVSSLNRLAIRGQFEGVFGEQSVADQATAAGLGGSLSSVLTDISNSVLPFTDVARELGVEVENLTDDEQTRTAALRILSSVLQENAAAEQEAARMARERRQELEREAQERRQVTQTRARLTEQFANLLSPEGIGLDTQLLARGFGGTDGPIAAVLKQEADAIANGELDIDLARSLAAQLQSAFVNETDQTPEAAQRFEEALRIINDAVEETVSNLNRLAIRGQFEGVFGEQSVADQATAAGLGGSLSSVLTDISNSVLPFTDVARELGVEIEGLTDDERTRTAALRILSNVLRDNAAAEEEATRAARERRQELLAGARDSLSGLRDEVQEELRAREQAIAEATQDLIDARSRERDALVEQRQEILNSAETYQRFVDQLRGTSEALLGGAGSPETPEDRFNRLRSEFESARTEALLGNEDALARLPDLADRLNDIRVSFLGAGTTDSVELFDRIRDTLERTADVAERNAENRMTEAEALQEQITQQEEQIEILRQQDDKLLTIAEAQARLADLIQNGPIQPVQDVTTQLEQVARELARARENDATVGQLRSLTSQIEGLRGQFQSLGTVQTSTGQTQTELLEELLQELKKQAA